MKTLTLLFCAILSTVAMAQGDPYHRYPSASRAPAPVQTTLGPEQVLRRGIDRLTGFLLGAQEASPKQVRAFIDDEVAPYFDFPYMARWAAGPLYRQLDAGQRANLTRKLRELFLDALARNLGSYRRPMPNLTVYRARPGRWRNEVRVGTLVTQKDAPSVRLDFRFYRGRGGWRIFDVTANGTSAVTYYRDYFTSLIRREGPQALSQ